MVSNSGQQAGRRIIILADTASNPVKHAQDMKRRGQWGHIIHISSMSAHRVPSPGDAFYAATKHAVRALAEGLRQEVQLLKMHLLQALCTCLKSSQAWRLHFLSA